MSSVQENCITELRPGTFLFTMYLHAVFCLKKAILSIFFTFLIWKILFPNNLPVWRKLVIWVVRRERRSFGTFFIKREIFVSRPIEFFNKTQKAASKISLSRNISCFVGGHTQKMTCRCNFGRPLLENRLARALSRWHLTAHFTMTEHRFSWLILSTESSTYIVVILEDRHVSSTHVGAGVRNGLALGYALTGAADRVGCSVVVDSVADANLFSVWEYSRSVKI